MKITNTSKTAIQNFIKTKQPADNWKRVMNAWHDFKSIDLISH